MSKFSYTLIILPLCFLLGCSGTSSKVTRETEKPEVASMPNIILITINSLRADHVGIYGYQRETTPNFDKFAHDNIFFNSAFSTSSWQMPSHGSIWTSLYPSEHGATHINKKLSANCATLPEILAEQGYYSGGFLAIRG